MKIVIPKAKNDQVREGHILYISRMDSYFCTIRWVEQYLRDTNPGKTKDSFLICPLAKTRRGHNAIGNRPINYTTVNDDFHRFIAPVCQRIGTGESSRSYGLYSLRSGGASTAINNGVSERLVGKHGRWKSGYTRDRYLKDDKRSRLSVTRAMSL